jgi:hypothetical protein
MKSTFWFRAITITIEVCTSYIESAQYGEERKLFPRRRCSVEAHKGSTSGSLPMQMHGNMTSKSAY